MQKQIPIGISDFKELIEDNYYFVDKSLLIKEVVEDGAKVILLPRPRRFGKTLNLSMLYHFFSVSPVNYQGDTAEEFSNYIENLRNDPQIKAEVKQKAKEKLLELRERKS